MGDVARRPGDVGNTGRGAHVFWRLFPLVWLVYLYFPLQEFLSRPRPAPTQGLGLLGVGVFLGLWARVYLLGARGDRRWVFAAYAWCLLLYFAGFLVIGYDSLTFLVYAGAVIGFQASLRGAIWGYVGVLAAVLLPGWLGAGQPGAGGLIQVLLLTAAALYGNHASYRQFIARVELERVQREKERLAADAERERIARDLHDLLGHTLSVIVLKSELAGKLAERDPARAAQEIREVERIGREALTEVRAAVHGYRGSGLSAELARAKVALDAAGVRLNVTGPLPELPAPTEAGAAMLLREAVTNVVRHAHAREVEVTLTRTAKGHRLVIRDDGVGGVGPEGSGLTGMRERLRALGGSLTRDGTCGTTLTADFPDEPGAEGAGRGLVTA